MKEIARARFGELNVEILQGDITLLEVDAIVNAANNHWTMGGGVAAAIKRAGGQEIEDEARRLGKRPIGQCVVTGAGRLKARHVIHAAVMGMDFETSAHFIREAVRNTLQAAQGLKVQSLALPAFGTGVGAFPFDQCAAIMLYEVNRFGRRSQDLGRVIFALFSEEGARAFADELNKYQSPAYKETK
jgi:O-acetyl-ADP-ribose deacetylase (regulator of RNase III)